MSSDDAAGVFPLRCCVQTYAWGKPGAESEVARLHAGSDEHFTIEENTPYAELWMGTHPKGPATITTTGALLSQYIHDNPSCLGVKVNQKFKGQVAGQLPFLFKVLSVNKSLSIQAHPTKVHAVELHARAPEHYPDDNHKPEMAIALTEFEGLCGFRPVEEIIQFIQGISELRDIVTTDNLTSLVEATAKNNQSAIKEALKECFSSLMMCDAKRIQKKVDQFLKRVENFDSSTSDNNDLCLDLFRRLNCQFPGDRGCFCIYFMNHMHLQAGEAMFLRANLPHAYLAGNCIECMACSDNVVRAGLTPKFIDVPTLCQMLDYTCKPPAENIYVPEQGSDDKQTVYNPPVQDFTVTRYQLSSLSEYKITPGDNPGILLTIHGSATSNQGLVHPGSIFFISSGQTLTLTDTSSDLLMFMAHCVL